MFQEVGHRIQSMNTKNVLTVSLLIATFLFVLMPILAYKSNARDPVVGSVVASSIFGILLNLVTIMANSCNNYFIIYIYFSLTILHAILNIAISISFPLLNLLVLNQIILVVVAFFHARNIRFGGNKNPAHV
ncbi:hypothetical protein BLOT_000366 [Blomia tropicalis]|nr:hypothetical protein BLOT_000366 [Blomia tropicalis]